MTRSLQVEGAAVSDQGAVWAEVESNITALGAASPTMAMHDAVRQRQDSISGYLDTLKYPAGAVGVTAAINGRFHLRQHRNVACYDLTHPTATTAPAR